MNSKYNVLKFISNKFEKIDFCKIDVQGEDFNVLKGMTKNLSKKTVRLIKIELLFMSNYKKKIVFFFII